MRIAVYLPALVSLLIAVTGPRLAGRRQSPAPAAWALTVGASLAAAAYLWSLGLIAATLVDDALPGPQGVRLVEGREPVNDLVASVAAVALAAGLVRLVHQWWSARRTYRELRAVCAAARSAPGLDGVGVVVLADPVPRAFAVPTRPGHVVVSSGMLAALRPDERRVLFAHEHAHLRRRHHRHTGVVRAAAAVNPLLVPLRAASTYLCERWADETAANAVGDRRLAATALARAALAGTPGPPPAPALGYLQVGVADRVTALRNPPAAARPVLSVALLALVVVALVADVHATGDFLHMAIGLMWPF